MSAEAIVEQAGRWRGIAAAIAAISVVGIGLSLQLPLLAFRLEEAGFSRTLIGLNTTAAGIAALVIAPFVPALVRALGLKLLMMGAVLLAAGAFATFPLVEPGWLWFPLRFLEGLALTTLFVTSEFWISAVSEERRRGLVLGLYGTALSLGFAAGPALLALVGTQGNLPFVAGSALMLTGLIPILLGGTGAPELGARSGAGLWALVVAVPAAALAALVYGAGESAVMSFLPLFGLRLGFDAEGAALLLTLVALGNVLFQIPLGLLSDRTDRVLVLRGCALVGLVGAALLPFVGANFWLAAALMLPWGGVIAGLYTVGLAHLAAQVPATALASANAAFVMLYSLGMLVGPLGAGVAMDLAPLTGLPLALVVLCAAYLVATMARPRVRPAHGLS